MLDEILNILKTSNLFLTGGGGVGKSYLTKKIIEHYNKNEKNVVVLGSTGISAINIGGVSVHSFFKFGISQNEEMLKFLDKKQKSKLAELKDILKNTDLIIIDEISMLSSELIEMINLRLIWAKFSGKILFVGDFYQLPPVKNKSQSSLFDQSYAFHASAWHSLSLTNVELVVSKRTNDIKLYNILSKIRIGVLDDEIISFLKSRIIKDIPKDLSVLFGKNSEANALNSARLKEIRSDSKFFSAKINVYDDRLSDEVFDKWVQNINLPYELELKIGAKVMFITNKWGEYHNGEQGVVVDFVSKNDKEFICIKKSNGDIIQIEPYKYELYEFIVDNSDVLQNIRADFEQFPLRLAYAITIHKAQGMSIEKFVCNLDNIFEAGQLYVALSRAINPDGLYINYTKNMDFEKYLRSIVKINPEVDAFYKNTNFIKEDIK